MAEGGYESGAKPSSGKALPAFMRRNPMDPDAVPAPLRRAMARVRADFEAATDLECSWWFEEPESDSDDDGGWVMCMIATDSALGFSVDSDSDEEEAAVRMADEGNEQVLETLGETESWEVAER